MKTPEPHCEYVVLKPYSCKELAGIYGVEKRTFHKWLEPFAAEVGEKHGRFYTVAQVRTIFTRLGLPGQPVED